MGPHTTTDATARIAVPKTSAHPVYTTRAPADLRVLRPLRDRFGVFLRAAGVRAPVLDGWLLAFTEAVANAIRHGAGETAGASIEVTWHHEPDAIALCVTDPGEGPATDGLHTASLPEETAEGGRGGFILRRFADDLETMQGTRGFALTIRKRHRNAPALPPPTEQDMEHVLEELSACYENLSAFHRLTHTLIGTDDVGGFLEGALLEFAHLHPFDEVRVVGVAELSERVHTALETRAWFSPVATLPPALQGLIETHSERIWDTPEERTCGAAGAADTMAPAMHRGATMPIVAGDTTFGVLLVGRCATEARVHSHTLSGLRTLADLFGMALAHAQMRNDRADAQRSIRELEIAVDIQRKLLPLLQPPRSAAWDVALHQASGRGVAGDYAIATTNARGDLVVAMVDVMGKGVTAALLASIFRTAFDLVRDVQPVDRLMATLNRVLCAQVGDMTMFATCAVARNDKNGHWLEHANAGHCHTLVFEVGGAVRQLVPSAPPLGLVPSMTYTSDRGLLRGGERIHFVSDGCYEFTENGELFGWPRLLALLQALRGETPDRVWEPLSARVAATSDDHALDDDCTLLTIDIAPAEDTLA